MTDFDLKYEKNLGMPVEYRKTFIFDGVRTPPYEVVSNDVSVVRILVERNGTDLTVLNRVLLQFAHGHPHFQVDLRSLYTAPTLAVPLRFEQDAGISPQLVASEDTSKELRWPIAVQFLGIQRVF